MSRRGRSRPEVESFTGTHLMPLLDVVLQLITFFMILVHFGSKLEGETASVRLPTAPAALPGGDLGLDRLVVAVDATGRLLADGTSFDESTAATWWAGQAESRRAGRATLGAAGRGEELPTLVVVRADKDASYGVVRRLLATAQDRGFANFTLVVLKGASL